MLHRQDALLWSLNERAAGRPGLDLPPPDLGWMSDVLDYEADCLDALDQDDAPDWDGF